MRRSRVDMMALKLLRVRASIARDPPTFVWHPSASLLTLLQHVCSIEVLKAAAGKSN